MMANATPNSAPCLAAQFLALRSKLKIGRRVNSVFTSLSAIGFVLLLNACASPCVQRYERAFNFTQDTFSYSNELVWQYQFDDASGKTSHRSKYPPPDYTHHCFVVARSARQFFQHARFDVAQPVADDPTYRALIHQVAGRDPMRCTPDEKRVVIPGYPNLREFSVAKEGLLKAECGGAWRSYFQRGHWRMLTPFTRSGQDQTAQRLLASLRGNAPPVVHLVRFPQLSINHAVLVFDARETEKEIEFMVYDPFDPMKPAVLTFDRSTRTFRFPRSPYFIGGKVDAYEIYRTWCY
jgi:hypothetical protein